MPTRATSRQRRRSRCCAPWRGRPAREFLEQREYRLSEGLDPAAPTLREVPALLWRAVRDCARFALSAERTDPGYPALLNRCREGIPEEHRDMFDGLLEEARATHHLRDERALYSDVRAWGILRSVCLEIGTRLLRLEEPRVGRPVAGHGSGEASVREARLGLILGQQERRDLLGRHGCRA